MTALTWDQDRNYAAGVDRCVLYLPTGAVAWSGVTSVTEDPGTVVSSEVYLDGTKSFTAQAVGEFVLTVEAFTYPDEFEDFKGIFGFTYRTKDENGYKIHLVYNALAEMQDKQWKTIASSTDPVGFQWTVLTKALNFPGLRPTAHFIVDEAQMPAEVFSAIELILYGSDDQDATLPEIPALVELYLTMTTLRIHDNGDGTWTAIGPDDAIIMLDDHTFQITWPTAVVIDTNTYSLSSG